MDHLESSAGEAPEISRRTLRLTFVASDDGIQLLSVEQLEMITPPQPGERPQVGKHGGQWFELRGSSGQTLAHRLIGAPFLDSVEVHSPDGKIQREFGATTSGVFEVLLPDLDEARSVVLVGNPLQRSKEPSIDIATFPLHLERGGPSR